MKKKALFLTLLSFLIHQQLHAVQAYQQHCTQAEQQAYDTNQQQLASLNRDLTKSQQTTRDWSTDRVDTTLKVDTRVFTEEGRKEVVEDFKKADELPGWKELGIYTGGIFPTYNQKGGLVMQIPALFTGDMEQYGDMGSSNVYINGMMNNQQQAMEGADNIIGQDASKQVWHNPTHGFFGDLIESGFDKFGLGMSGNSRQVNDWMGNANGILDIHMHSQGNLIGKRGGFNNPQHNYYSFGAPMSHKNIQETFGTDTHIEMNRGDWVSGLVGGNYIPPNNSLPSGGHGTECYGVSRSTEKCQ